MIFAVGNKLLSSTSSRVVLQTLPGTDHGAGNHLFPARGQAESYFGLTYFHRRARCAGKAGMNYTSSDSCFYLNQMLRLSSVLNILV